MILAPAPVYRFAVSTRFIAVALAAALFACIFVVLHWLMPLTPRATLAVNGEAQFLEFSRDSSMIATARNADGKRLGPLQVWDVQTGKERFAIGHGWTALELVHFSPNNQHIAAHCKNQDLKVWDVATGRELCSVSPPPHRTIWFCFDFSADGKLLVMSEDSTTLPDRSFIRFWSIGANREVERIEDFWTGQLAPDGHSVANVGYSAPGNIDRVMIWSSPGDGPRRLLREFRLVASGASFSPDLSTMASFIWRGGAAKPIEISLWDMATGLIRCSFTYHEPDTNLQDLSFSHDGRLLVANGGAGTNRYDWHTRTSVWDITATPRKIGSFAPSAKLSSDGQWLAVPLESGATLYQVAGMQAHGNLTVTHDSARPTFGWSFGVMPEYPSLTFSPDSRFLAVERLYHETPKPSLMGWMPRWVRRFFDDEVDNSVVRLWETDVAKQDAAFFRCRQVFFSPDSKTLATVHSDGIIKLWALPLRRPLAMSLTLSGLVWLVFILVWQCAIRLIWRG
jgi:WD40 repeat protein